MTALLINGKEIARNKRQYIAEEVKKLRIQEDITPGLAVILAGNDPASKTYVNHKRKACQEVGIRSVLIEYPPSIAEEVLIAKVKELNQDPQIHGILVQLPLPEQIKEEKVIAAISPDKDVDGFHPVNVGRMMIGVDAFFPCTPYGIMEMLKEMQISLEGKEVVIIGRSNIVGKPAGQLFLRENATVTYCHSKTKNLTAHTRNADIVVAAVGKAEFIHADDIKKDAIVIDVGMNRNKEGKLCGDVCFADVKEKAKMITPVPGGVGPMTIAMLLQNTLKAAKTFASRK
ncbi:bifunctional methylenetetrahydrofolate dehydrogenase/methenyltetrahydrofolate cyclohydrolase FolD [Bacillaceae bacterium Marseille-Q3522]|nr:bifunctional methylenetetrahydrofolate dehydrogenase/methenyltetrahydrofolate cyclohydrolase FolD [Bacillaceae bacterium Marseille-Q3522]